MKIYTITMVEKIHSNEISSEQKWPDFGDRRCVGYYTTYEAAVRAILVCDLHRDEYKYCIIEEIPEGVYKDTPRRWVFERQGDNVDDYIYTQIKEPEEMAKVRNFGIG